MFPFVFPRDGNGTGRREAIWWTGWVGLHDFLLISCWDMTERDRVRGREIAREHSREIVRENNRVIGREGGGGRGRGGGMVGNAWLRPA